ncbi:hypothetical protein PPHE_a2712 [Pseudoalteromonas phenolica O-BC30]|nr:hypothetical protein [Pseudoalteromonas phenolica O-BC30]
MASIFKINMKRVEQSISLKRSFSNWVFLGVLKKRKHLTNQKKRPQAL